MHLILRTLLLNAALLGGLAGAVQASEALSVSAERVGELFKVQAQATVQAPLAVVWGTLTDYEHQPAFIPGLHRSRILGRNGATTTVEQSGEARFLFLTLPIEVTTESTERPPVLEVRRVGGSLRHLQGRYETEVLAGHPARVRLRWDGTIALDLNLPTRVAEVMVRRQLQEQFEGMLREIERRAQAPQPTITQP